MSDIAASGFQIAWYDPSKLYEERILITAKYTWVLLCSMNR
jgi:hypothetical protein